MLSKTITKNEQKPVHATFLSVFLLFFFLKSVSEASADSSLPPVELLNYLYPMIE